MACSNCTTPTTPVPATDPVVISPPCVGTNCLETVSDLCVTWSSAGLLALLNGIRNNPAVKNFFCHLCDVCGFVLDLVIIPLSLSSVRVSFAAVPGAVSYSISYYSLGGPVPSNRETGSVPAGTGSVVNPLGTTNVVVLAPATSAVLSGLLAGTTYQVSVVTSCDGAAQSIPSTGIFVTGPCPPAANVVLSTITTTSARVDFTPSSGASSYTVTTVPATVTRSGPAGSMLLTGLTPGVFYTVHVQANCSATAQSIDATGTFTTLIDTSCAEITLNTPGVVRGTALETANYALSWVFNSPGSSDAAKTLDIQYRIYDANEPRSWVSYGQYSQQLSSVLLTLPANTVYEFQVLSRCFGAVTFTSNMVYAGLALPVPMLILSSGTQPTVTFQPWNNSACRYEIVVLDSNNGAVYTNFVTRSASVNGVYSLLSLPTGPPALLNGATYTVEVRTGLCQSPVGAAVYLSVPAIQTFTVGG